MLWWILYDLIASLHKGSCHMHVCYTHPCVASVHTSVMTQRDTETKMKWTLLHTTLVVQEAAKPNKCRAILGVSLTLQIPQKKLHTCDEGVGIHPWFRETPRESPERLFVRHPRMREWHSSGIAPSELWEPLIGSCRGIQYFMNRAITHIPGSAQPHPLVPDKQPTLNKHSQRPRAQPITPLDHLLCNVVIRWHSYMSTCDQRGGGWTKWLPWRWGASQPIRCFHWDHVVEALWCS